MTRGLFRFLFASFGPGPIYFKLTNNKHSSTTDDTTRQPHFLSAWHAQQSLCPSIYSSTPIPRRHHQRLFWNDIQSLSVIFNEEWR